MPGEHCLSTDRNSYFYLVRELERDIKRGREREGEREIFKSVPVMCVEIMYTDSFLHRLPS